MLPELIPAGVPWLWVGGKGGVGKTTVSAALALGLAERGETTLVLSLDPAHSLADALCAALGPEPRDVPGVPGLSALEVDAEHERASFLARHGAALRSLLERGSYLEAAEADEFLGLSVPGMDELAAMLRLMALVREGAYARVVLDTAPTGHTLRLLSTPDLAMAWLGALEALESRHQAVARSLAPGFGGDHTSAFLAELRAGLADLGTLLRDPRRTRFLLVTTAEPLVLAETERYRRSLAEAGVALGALVVNRSAAEPHAPASDSAWPEGLRSAEVPRVHVPPLAEEPRCVEGLRRFAASAGATRSPHRDRASPAARRVRVGEAFRAPRDRRLYVVAGKGGVGKTTAASALALALAERSPLRTLLLSTDPAGSLSDVWETAVGAEPVTAPGAPRIELRQLDAAAEWAGFRAEYRDEVERFFAAALGGALSLGPDREVVRRLPDLAPPGVDEVMALRLVIDLLEEPAYYALVLDTAPTGHLLRLLEMPRLAIDWAHAIMRLLLRYREVVGLGGLAERVLSFARAVRALRELLADRRRTCAVVVALPEQLSVAETTRLLARLEALDMGTEVLLINRLLDPRGGLRAGTDDAAAALLQGAARVAPAGAPELADGPHGAPALRAFLDSWRRLELIDDDG